MSYYSVPFTFEFSTSRIAIDSGVTDIDCIQLYTATKLAQASQEGIIYGRIAKGSGLSTLGPAVQVGLTVELLGSWQLQFPIGNYVARVAGGNLIGGPGGDPIAYSAGVQTLLIQSAASTIVTSGGGSTIVMLPSVGVGTEANITSRELVLTVDATHTLVRMIIDANGNQITLPSNCTFVLTDENELPLTELTPSLDGATYTVVIPRNLTTRQRTINFALRIPTSNIPLDYGTIQFIYAATATA